MKKHNVTGFFWTAHNELEERWDYVKAWDAGWINTSVLPPPPEVEEIRRRERKESISHTLEFLE